MVESPGKSLSVELSIVPLYLIILIVIPVSLNSPEKKKIPEPQCSCRRAGVVSLCNETNISKCVHLQL